ncbi:isochorismatase family protein, partial [Enterococcus faecalis]|uniref:isochorismatase family protein n=1 Tax=Enterococcus faecalis TaxID=1351 RepID=UPI003CC5D1DE
AFYQTNLNDLLTEQAFQTLEIAGVQTEFCVDTTIRLAHGLGYTCLMTPKTTSTLDIGHLTAAQIIQHHEAIWDRGFLTFYPSINLELFLNIVCSLCFLVVFLVCISKKCSV